MLRRASEPKRLMRGANLALMLGKIRPSFYSSSSEEQQRLHMHTDNMQRVVGTRAGLLIVGVFAVVGRRGLIVGVVVGEEQRETTDSSLTNLRVTMVVAVLVYRVSY